MLLVEMTDFISLPEEVIHRYRELAEIRAGVAGAEEHPAVTAYLSLDGGSDQSLCFYLCADAADRAFDARTGSKLSL
jgi:hypothetical protein